MINVFLSHSGKDKDLFGAILDNLESLNNYCNFWYYQPIKILIQVDLFVVFISHNSLSSTFVQEEMSEAIRLSKLGKIKGICPISIDISISANSDSRIPEYIKKNICDATASPIRAAQIIEEKAKKLCKVI